MGGKRGKPERAYFFSNSLFSWHFDKNDTVHMTFGSAPVWLTDEKHYEKMIRKKKKKKEDWNYTSRNGRGCGKHTPSPKWITVLSRKNKLSSSCLSVSHKGRAGKESGWWLYHVTSLPEWGNRRWHLADSLALADLLGVGWLLWFWNYSLDELEHFTKKKKKKKKGQ